MKEEEMIAVLKASAEEIKKNVETKNAEMREAILKELGVDALKSEIKSSNEALEKLQGQIDAIEAKAKEGGNNIFKSFETQIKEQIVENFDKIKSIFAAKSGVIQLDLKAVGTITNASGTNTLPPALTGSQQAPLSPISLRNIDITRLTTVMPTDQAAYPYTEVKPKDGDYAFLAEEAIKPQIDFSFDTKYAEPKKIAAWIKLTDEAIKDIKGLQGIATDFLKKKHDLFKNKGILYGDGVGANAKGATTYGRTFVAGAMALQVEKPNFMDVVNAVITDISVTHNYQDEEPYMANLVLVNPIDFFLNLVSAKTTEGVSLYPQASLNNQVVIGGTTIMPEETIPTGKIFVADMEKYNTTDWEGYTVKIGYVNDDFIKNQFVILGESRFHAFVKKLDEQAFVYDTIATIKTAITKP